MTFKELIKTTEALIVLIGSALIVLLNSLSFMIAIVLAVLYVAINVPAFMSWIKARWEKLKSNF